MKKIYIFGASGFGREVAWLIEELNEWEIAGFLDDNPELLGKTILSYSVLGNEEYLSNLKGEVNVVIAIANPYIKEKIYERIKSINHLKFPNIIAKNVRVHCSNRLGMGNVVCNNSSLTVNVELGNFNHVNPACTLGHDVVIGDFSTVYPGCNISGNVKIGRKVQIGVGSKIIQQINIADEVITGAGCVVIKSLTEEGTYVGCPARKL